MQMVQILFVTLIWILSTLFMINAYLPTFFFSPNNWKCLNLNSYIHITWSYYFIHLAFGIVQSNIMKFLSSDQARLNLRSNYRDKDYKLVTPRLTALSPPRTRLSSTFVLTIEQRTINRLHQGFQRSDQAWFNFSSRIYTNKFLSI